MSRSPPKTARKPSSFPRVSGDEPLTHTNPDAPVTFSPRERG